MGSMVELVGPSKRTYAKVPLPGLLLPVFHSHGEPLLTHTFTGDPPTLTGRSGSASSGVTAPLLWVLVHTRFLYPPGWESLFPPILWKSYNQISQAFKVRFPEDSQSVC